MALSTALPTLYDYYTAGGISTGLSANQPYFTLNDRNITIYSGAMHYFRVPKPYWRDRLRKMRAAGLNAVETYVPWNLHEFQNGQYDFGDGGSDMEEFLDIKQYLTIAQEEDLFVIVRAGPYICAEWEWGGLPSWLLHDDTDMKVRTSDETFMTYVTRYFNILLPILALLQFTTYGGPIIAFQVENEYGNMQADDFTPDKVYLEQLRQLMINNGINELLVTSDSARYGTIGSLPNTFLQTVNFGSDPETQFDTLKEFQPDRPVMAMEFWTGWYDHWTEEHHTRTDEEFYDLYERILKYPDASVNMYMFHGGTNWGFLNGGNMGDDSVNANFQPTTTSYDYDAPLSEAGDYTSKYDIVKELIKQYNPIETSTPDPPELIPRVAYDAITLDSQLSIYNLLLLNEAPSVIQSSTILAVETLPVINNNSGQSYGYTVYRKDNLDMKANQTLTVGGHICDTLVVVLNGIPISPPLTNSDDLNSFGYWRQENSTITLTVEDLINATLDLVVENWGRANIGRLSKFKQYKGLWQQGIYLDDEELLDWKIIPLEFKTAWTNNLSGWIDIQKNDELVSNGPTLYKSSFTVGEARDTFVDMRKWVKGVVIVNGFVLGRYAMVGPQQTLYLPGAFLREGQNEIVIFEHFSAPNEILFSQEPIYYTQKYL